MATCYHQINNQILVATTMVSCGPSNGTNPYVPCCVSAGICLTDSMCQSTHSIVGGSGYYVGGCTDPTFSDPSCAKRCTNDQTLPDATYNQNRQLWQCCGMKADGTPHCADPTSETFLAPAPANLIAYYTPSTANRTSATSSSSAPTSTSSTSSIPDSSSSKSKGGLSTGAKAGIGVGVAIVALVLLGIVAVFLFRRRRRRNNTPAAAAGSTDSYNNNTYDLQNHHHQQQQPYQPLNVAEKADSDRAVAHPHSPSLATNGYTGGGVGGGGGGLAPHHLNANGYDSTSPSPAPVELEAPAAPVELPLSEGRVGKRDAETGHAGEGAMGLK